MHHGGAGVHRRDAPLEPVRPGGAVAVSEGEHFAARARHPCDARPDSTSSGVGDDSEGRSTQVVGLCLLGRAVRRAVIDDDDLEVAVRLAGQGLQQLSQQIAPVADRHDDGDARCRVHTVRWAQASRFGMQFSEPFDLTRLAPRREKHNDVTMLKPWYVDKAVGE